MTDNLPAIPPRGGRGIKYTAEEVDRALITLAMSRSAQDAADKLKDQGIITPSTRQILYWRKKYEDRYVELREKHQDEIEKITVVEQFELVRDALAGTAEAVALSREQIKRGEVKDAAAAARNLQTVAAIGIDKIMAFQGRPTSVVKHLSGEEALRNLAKWGRVVDSTAEDVDDDGE